MPEPAFLSASARNSRHDAAAAGASITEHLRSTSSLSATSAGSFVRSPTNSGGSSGSSTISRTSPSSSLVAVAALDVGHLPGRRRVAPEAPAVARVHAERVIRGVHDAVGRAVVPRPGKVVPERALVPELASRSSVEHRAQQRAVAVEVGALAAVLAVTLDEEHAGFVRVGPRAGVHPPVAPRAHPFTTVPAVLPSRVRPARAEMGRVSRGRRPVPGPAGRSSRGRHGPAPRPSREPPRAEVLARGGRDRRRRRGGVELPFLQLPVIQSNQQVAPMDGTPPRLRGRPDRPDRPRPGHALRTDPRWREWT